MDNNFANELDNQLYSSILSEDILKIEDLLKKGANINAIDKFFDNMIIKYIQEKGFESNIEIIKCIIDNGINSNYENEGFNCLFNAYLSNRDDIVEYLLEIGTSAQCISTDTCETLLDWIEWDVDFEKDNDKTSIEWIERSEKIIHSLKKYGATSAEECFTKNVEEYIKMFGGGNTGLFTRKGYIYIEDLPDINEDLIRKYYEWKNVAQIFSEKTWNKENIDINKLKENNEVGLIIINSIKELLPKNIKIQFNFIIPEDYEKSKNRNIKELIINAK